MGCLSASLLSCRSETAFSLPSHSSGILKSTGSEPFTHEVRGPCISHFYFCVTIHFLQFHIVFHTLVVKQKVASNGHYVNAFVNLSAGCYYCTEPCSALGFPTQSRAHCSGPTLLSFASICLADSCILLCNSVIVDKDLSYRSC